MSIPEAEQRRSSFARGTAVPSPTADGSSRPMAARTDSAKYLHYARNLDPLLPFPYAHRLHLLSDPRIGGADREKRLRHLRDDLTRLEQDPNGAAVVQRLSADFPGAEV